MREIAPFGVRMPPELKARLLAEALRNGRSMNTEVVARLAASLSDQEPRAAMEPAANGYLESSLSPADRDMLVIFRRLSTEKQLALLSLFR
jgi:plasmid stability protein